MRKITNNTAVDALGAKLNLYREPNEDIVAFQKRIKACLSYGLHRHKESFEDSLDYLTAKRFKQVMLVDTQEKKTVSFDGVFLTIDETSTHIKEFKFLKEFKAFLETNGFAVTALDDYDQYLKTEKLVQFSSSRTMLNYTTPATNLFKFNERFVSNVYDQKGLYSGGMLVPDFQKDYDSWSRGNNLEEFYLNNESEMLRENNSEDVISYSYENYPLLINWSEITYYNLNDQSADYRLNELWKVHKGEEKTPYKLTQEGAQLFNKCLQISNTYWGK